MPTTKKTKKSTTTNTQMTQLSEAVVMIKKLQADYQHLAGLAAAVLETEIDFQGITKRGTRKWFRKNPSRRLSPQKGQAKKKEDYVASPSELAIAALRAAIHNTPAVKAKRKAKKRAALLAKLAALDDEE